MSKTLPERLRDAARKLRTSNMPLSDFIPLLQQAADYIEAQGVPDVGSLTDAIAEGLRGTYYCTRAWEAWHVGTMHKDDFEPVDESETPRELAETVIAMLAAAPPAPQPQPVQPTPTINDYLINQSTVPLPADFLQFWQTINPKAMTRRILALTAWNISKHEAKKQFKTMTISKTFDNSNAENLTILDLSDKVFLRDLSTQAKEMAESPGCAPAWAATYMALEASASMLADLIENTEVRDA